MTGTQNHEGVAGVTAAVEYLAAIDGGNGSSQNAQNRRFDTSPRSFPPNHIKSELNAARGREGEGGARRERLRRTFSLIVEHERELGARLIAGLQQLQNLAIWGITDPARLQERVPTISVTHATLKPQDIATKLAERGLWTWAGNHYALPLTETFGLEPHGTLRIGLVHYNTADEVDRLLAALAEIV
ncbi:MAG: aminotransferase class V-fold PLP-dependent enzyme [Pirellulales bacterium]